MAEQAADAATPILKVLAGVQKGAEIVLQEQLYTIGSDESCKIVLLEDGVAAIHIQAAYLNGNLSILECQDDVHIDGKPVGKPPVTIGSGQLVSFGSMLLSFGARDQDWEKIVAGAKLIESAGSGKAATPASPLPAIVPRRRRWRLMALAVPAVALGLGIVGAGDDEKSSAGSSQAAPTNNVMFQRRVSDPVTDFKKWLASEQQ
ncbi:MAG: hypothetical protein OXC81_01845, partial [Betaproteobacteria bacterium]|nr:hypothetical protein [Betaproteobacteria bacterium]